MVAKLKTSFKSIFLVENFNLTQIFEIELLGDVYSGWTIVNSTVLKYFPYVFDGIYFFNSDFDNGRISEVEREI
jgi:hypothetical protein